MLALLTQRRFAPLFWTQFLAAFNDNFLKNALIFLIMAKLSATEAQTRITLAGGIFILPFFLLSGLGGQMADRFDKARMAQRLKLSELAASALSVAGFVAQSIPLLFLALLLFGTVSSLFGPIKYGILPDCLRKHELPAGNAMIEGATFIAILLGTLAGGLASRNGGDPAPFAVAMTLISLACYGASLLIPPTGEAAPKLVIDANIFRSTGQLLASLWADRNLWRAGVMVSLFWMFGIVALSLLPPMVKIQMGGDEMAVSLLLALFAVSVGLGSGLGAFFCRDGIKLAPAPFAALFIALSAADLAFTLHGMAPAAAPKTVAEFFADATTWRVAFDLALFALAGGVLAVPSFSAAQAWAPSASRARVIAAINVLNAAFMVLGTLVFSALQAAGLSLAGAAALLALTGAASALWMFKYRPQDPPGDPA
ncbi:MFS transporter [uncultured Rhodoblastus sp.]|uniref:MFS transporter n=1 Tax=uncultured Rhodoblastus sp. TaxID=543037 RepID=UPI0025E5C9F0|nr:MFS transporter [uncultured Rhodoblastus sp.]